MLVWVDGSGLVAILVSRGFASRLFFSRLLFFSRYLAVL